MQRSENVTNIPFTVQRLKGSVQCLVCGLPSYPTQQNTKLLDIRHPKSLSQTSKPTRHFIDCGLGLRFLGQGVGSWG